MKTEIVKIIQALRTGDQEKAEAYANQLKINSDKSNNLGDKLFSKRILDAFHGVPADPEKVVCLDGDEVSKKHCMQCKTQPVCRGYQSILDFSGWSSCCFGEYRQDIVDGIIHELASNCIFYDKVSLSSSLKDSVASAGMHKH